MNRRVAVRAVIVKDGKLLAVKLNPYRSVITGEFWCTIGGGIDEGEALIPALKREVMEETGIEPIVGNLLYIQQYLHGDMEHMEFFFHVTNADDFLTIDLSKTTHGTEEIAELDFVDVSKETVLPKFLTEETFEDVANQPTKFFNYL